MDFTNLKKTTEYNPPRLVVYGPQGVGKSTLTSQAPDVVFMQVEDGLDGIESFKQKVETWDDVVQMIDALLEQEHKFSTLAIDSADWLEAKIINPRVVEDYNAKATGAQKISVITEVPYGKGPDLALAYWEQLLDGLNALREQKEMMIIFVAHDKVKRFDDPLGQGYDRYMLKLQDKAAALMQEWADGVLFMKRKSVTVQEDVGFNKKVSKAKDAGGVYIHAKESPAYQAKNRTMLSLPDEFHISVDNAWKDFEANIGSNKPKAKVNTPLKKKADEAA